MKASTNLQSVNLFVMPYNYPTVIALLDELVKVHKYKPNVLWKQRFDNYLKTMPLYYAQVRTAFNLYLFTFHISDLNLFCDAAFKASACENEPPLLGSGNARQLHELQCRELLEEVEEPSED